MPLFISHIQVFFTTVHGVDTVLCGVDAENSDFTCTRKNWSSKLNKSMGIIWNIGGQGL